MATNAALLINLSTTGRWTLTISRTFAIKSSLRTCSWCNLCQARQLCGELSSAMKCSRHLFLSAISLQKPQADVREGHPGNQTVVIELESVAAVKAAYEAPDAQASSTSQ